MCTQKRLSKVPEIPAYLDKAYQAASEAAGQVDIPGMSHEQKVKIYADKFKEAGVDLNNLTNDQQSLLNAMNAGKGELKNLLEQQRVKGVPYKEPGLSETAEKVSEHFPYSSKKHIVRTLIKDVSSGGIDPSQTPLDAIWKLALIDFSDIIFTNLIMPSYVTKPNPISCNSLLDLFSDEN